jgi:hypothetical protein
MFLTEYSRYYNDEKEKNPALQKFTNLCVKKIREADRRLRRYINT